MRQDTIRSTDRQSKVWRHTFVYLWLTVAAVTAPQDDDLSTELLVGALVLTAALGGWYWYWHISEAARRRELPDRAYLIAGMLGWAILVAIDTDFLVVGVSVLAPYCFESLRWALAILVPCAATWLWQAAASRHGLDWFDFVIPLLVVATGAAVTGYVTTLARQNAERQRLIDELQAAQSELAAAERQAGILAERQRLARDIHDTVTQGFASIVMLLEAAEESSASEQVASRHVSSALGTARDSLDECRRVVWALRPDVLAQGRLPEAIGSLAYRLQEATGLRTDVVVTGTPRSLDPDVETALLRLAQEGLANVRKHADATRASVTISYMDDLTVLDIQDDGVGFDPNMTEPTGEDGGMGLRAMRERVEELGGRLAIESVAGEGTTVVVELPDPRPTVLPTTTDGVVA